MKFYYHILLVVFFLIFIGSTISAQNNAFLNCLEVDDGTVILSWIPPEDINGFVEYIINYSTTGINFTPIDSEGDPSTNQYIHLNAQAESGSRHYYITTVYSNISFNSDTLQTIFLQVDDTDPAFAKLYWNSEKEPIPDTPPDQYQILKEYHGMWSIIDTVIDIYYNDPILFCSDSLTYQIILENGTGCISVSNLSGGWFENLSHPAIPVFDSVSINQQNKAFLGWTHSTSSDVIGYIIYRYEDPNWIEIGKISDTTSTFYIDTVPDACTEIASYAIAAIDSCGLKSEGTFDNPRNTILLNEIENNVCEASNLISWSPYINAIPQLDSYDIYCSQEFGPFVKIGETEPGTMEFLHDSIQTGSTYTYYVQAIFGENSSSSCKKSITTSSYQKPSFVYLANADVLPTYEVELSIAVDTLVYDCSWEIWRSDTNGGNLHFIESVEKFQLDGYPLMFTDTTAEAWEGFYEYLVTVLDSCGRETLESNVLKTIHLGGSIVDDDHISLQWNAFEGWNANVEKYNIFRMVNGNEPTEPIDFVNAETLSYIDNVGSIGGSSEPLTYWVQVVEKSLNEYGFQEKSNSNRIGLTPETEMYVANAYIPTEHSADFKPVFRFFGGSEYLFQIYNRWGQLIFETRDPDVGWDGKQNGQYVPLGTYVYSLGYKNIDATTESKKGTVTVIY